MEKVRVRFAPSPTGPLHLGGVRTALYDYLFAKNKGGEFVLRIEDTDTARYVEGAEEYIEEALEWCGIIPDESPKKGGKYAPYRQSERREIYDAYTQKILQTNWAYIAFDTPEELELLRTEYEAKGLVFSYNNSTRNSLKNSITLSDDEVKELLDKNTPYVVRFKMPLDRVLVLEDLIRGTSTVNTNVLDDKVLVKNDGMPTYHFANVIDDFEMKITHVIRGEEWLPSLGLHVLLYEAMGWKAPQFAHLSLILKPVGKGKLSKRDGDQFGFPVFPLEYKDPATQNISDGFREKGYLPEAFVNMVALLGWSPSDDKEICSMEELIAEFSLDKVHKAGARFNKEKAEWFNHQYIQLKTNQELLDILKTLPVSLSLDDKKCLSVIELMKERVHFPIEMVTLGKFFFEAPTEFDEKAVKKAWSEETPLLLSEWLTKLEQIEPEKDKIKQSIQDFATEKQIGLGKIMMPLRLSLVGEMKGPDIQDIIDIIGKEETKNRIKKAINTIS